MTSKRKSWDDYFMAQAELASERATCDRIHVGCVLVRNKDVISTGYNGSVAGMAHCDDVGHDMEDGHCVATVHAEMNALMMAARNGHSTAQTTCYTTHFPCWLCTKLLLQAGVKRIVFLHSYRPNDRVLNACRTKRVQIDDLTLIRQLKSAAKASVTFTPGQM